MFYLYEDDSLRTQHNAVRTTAGWFDFTHRVLEVTGSDAAAFLNKMYLVNLDGLAVGKGKYTTMLDEEGLICDDVIIFRLEDNKYWISTLYTKDLVKRFAWYDSDFDVAYDIITDDWKMYSVQGPKSLEIVNGIIDDTADDLKYFTIKNGTMGSIPLKIARLGFTGEKYGYEIYVPSEHFKELEAKLEEEGAKIGALQITEIDVMAMTLAAEAGYYLMLDMRRCTPFEVDLEKTIDWNKDFVGKAALLRVKDKAPKRKLVGIEIPDRNAVIYGGPHGATVEKEGKPVGRITKFTYGFTVEKNIGYALVDSNVALIGDTLTSNGYDVVITEKNWLA